MSKIAKFLTETQVIDSPEKANVLLVDRDQDFLDQFSKSLEKCDYNVKNADSVWKAFEYLIDYRFDLLISNTTLPGTTCQELVRYCRKRHPAMEILVISSEPSVPEAVSLVKAGAYDYIEMPQDHNFLCTKADNALTEKKRKLILALTQNSAIDGKLLNPLPSVDVIKQLGSGSTGIVFHVKKNMENYALKLLRPDLASKFLKRSDKDDFLKEAKILSEIKHPNIVRLYDYGFSGNNMPYILMEFVEGGPLTDYIKNKRVELKDRIKIFLQICSSVSHIHKFNVLHRDLKPGNIMIGKGLNVKLTDFGLAHFIDPDNYGKNKQIIGSPAYMAPESFEKSAVIDHRSDIFSLGVLGYELFTRHKPFKGKNLPEMVHSIKNDKPAAPQKLHPQIPESLQNLLANMLTKEHSERTADLKSITLTLKTLLKHGKSALDTTRKKFAFFGSAGRDWA
ncbi:protein kinase [Lentisphaerota bacterium ZTH]|nr:protein kinase [Lentisphaerota bacterium]WET05425.1 protein kinase [Lentisphaerota bacterium ZTH]